MRAALRIQSVCCPRHLRPLHLHLAIFEQNPERNHCKDTSFIRKKCRVCKVHTMPPKDNTPTSPSSPRAGRAQHSLESAFEQLTTSSSKGKERSRQVSGESASSISSMRDAFAQRWPPALDFGGSFKIDFENISISSFDISSVL